MTTKIPFDRVYLHLENEWQKEFDTTDPDSVQDINEHCDSMIVYVEACGWNVDDFIRQMMKEGRRNN